MQEVSKTWKLSNGVEIPTIGFGTWLSKKGEECEKAVADAIACGYRHIDGAAGYFNEESVGAGIKASGIDRKELFLTSKLHNPVRGYEETIQAFEKTIHDLQTEYLDLYLIHWPRPKAYHDNYIEKNKETWKAFEDLYKQGKIKAIGVSNFLPHHLEELAEDAEILPMVNQIEYHPSHLQETIISYCRQHGILVEGYSPLARGRIFEVEKMHEIAEKYGKNVAQVTLRWSMQNGVIPLPKSVTAERIESNYQVYDFTLSEEDMEFINQITECASSDRDPDNIEF